MSAVSRRIASWAQRWRAGVHDIWSYQQLSQNSSGPNRSRDSRCATGLLPLSRRQWRLFASIAASLSIFTAFVVYSRDDGMLSSTGDMNNLRMDISKETFIAAILREPVEGLLDPEPIRRKCNETKFQEGLVWDCAAGNGGIGNEANMWLNCVRYAIEAGATTMILPRLGVRSDDLLDLGGEDKSVDLSYLFDIPYFLKSWNLVCPQIRAVLSDTEVSNLPSLADSPKLSPSSVKSFEMRKYLIVDPTGWREAFDIWLAKNADINLMSAKAPVRVYQNLVLAQWNREAHSREFAVSFPRLFRYPLQTRRLAASVLWTLEKRLERPVVPNAIIFSSTGSLVNTLRPHRLTPHSFLGAHLRVSADAAKAGWPGYEAQAPFYLAEAKRLNLTAIYLATGSSEHRERFRADAELQGLKVLVKEDLLEDQELAELQTLTWDQQALVDFDVLMHSAFFYGFVRSSFTWSLAVRRGTLQEAGNSRTTDEDEYRDDLSAIVGRYGSINPEGLWP